MSENVQSSVALKRPAHSRDVRAGLEQRRSELQALLSGPNAGLELARRHADVMDEVLSSLYASASAVDRDSVLVGAVGGYGRRVLGLKSDLDVCFVTAQNREQLAPLVDELLYPLWDAGISVGHQVLTLADIAAAASDLPTATELLDFRPLFGNMALARALQDRLFAEVFCEAKVAAFVARLEQQARLRHARFGDSVYLLEPEVKNGTGGLRDLDYALWAARARFHTSELADLTELGILSAARREEAERALDFVWTVRNHLHAGTERKSDRLTFAAQEQLARELGYGECIDIDPVASPVEHMGAMVEAFMSDYYRSARVITQVSELIFGHAKRRHDRREREQSLGAGLVTCEGGIALLDPAQLAGEPALALRLYAAAVARDQPVLARTRDAVAQATSDASFCERLRASREAASMFVQLVASRRRSPFAQRSIVAELHEVGLLLAMIPEFAPVVGRVHHDIYHVYTVDVHSVAAVDRLHALARGELATDHPLGSRLAAEISNPRMLALATLLHDVGKAIGGHNHAQRGAEMARGILTRLGLASDDVDDACHLILKHLTLYVVAARRDLGDPATIRDFAKEVRGREGLRDLYLLTVADLSTTSPNAMTKWKAGMLDALYRATDSLLKGGGSEPTRLSRVRAQVIALWPEECSREVLDEYLDSMPERYLLTNTPAEIAAHARIATEPQATPVAATFMPSKVEDVLELCVVTAGTGNTGLCVVASDRPGLLAAISAAIAANRLHIQAAQIHSRKLANGGVQAVDLFWVHLPPEDDIPLDQRRQKIQRDLNALITGQLTPRELFKPQRSSLWSMRPLPPVQTEVMIEHHASSRYTVIEVLTQDRPALLFDVAEALHTLGLTIRVAKISTEGTRVIDVFYVTEADGSKVAQGARTDEVRALLLDTLRAQAAA